MLEPFAQDIWIAEGQPINAAMGFHYPTRMTVMRRDDGALLIWSAIALTNELRETVEDMFSCLWIVCGSFNIQSIKIIKIIFNVFTTDYFGSSVFILCTINYFVIYISKILNKFNLNSSIF